MDKINISGSNNMIYINESDSRGRWLKRKNGVTQPVITEVWRRAVKKISPTIAIDVGLNYGEILFSTTYRRKTLLFGIEANKELAKYIKKSQSIHPNKEQIKVIYAIASDKNLETDTFFINKQFSGKSTAAKEAAKKYKKTRN